jgi:GNAT superfamily N-acetyltransferase
VIFDFQNAILSSFFYSCSVFILMHQTQCLFRCYFVAHHHHFSMTITIRRYVQATDEAAVRRIWSAGLLANTRQLDYPAGLVAEEESFVRSTLASGDMFDLSRAYQSAQAVRDGAFFWVATEAARAGVLSAAETVVIGMIGIKPASSSSSSSSSSTTDTHTAMVADLSRFGVSLSHRRRGIGARLLAVAEAHAWQAGFGAVRAITTGLNVPALAAYARAGYQERFRGRRDGRHDQPPFVTVVKAGPH